VGFGRIERGLWVLVILLVIATLAVVALRFGAEATDSVAPPASTREASPVLSEELRVPRLGTWGKREILPPVARGASLSQSLTQPGTSAAIAAVPRTTRRVS
jgi:hypothetical protein